MHPPPPQAPPVPKARQSRLARFTRQLASMRFAVGIMLVLVLVAVLASLIAQHEPPDFYRARYGALGAWLLALGLDDAYAAWWFIALLAFLVLSVGLCVAQRAPRYWHSWWQSWRDTPDTAPAPSLPQLHAMPCSTQARLRGAASVRAHAAQALLARQGWRSQIRLEKAGASPPVPTGHLLIARKGATRKLGYIATHSAIVLLCLGGLLDSGLWLRWQRWQHGMQPMLQWDAQQPPPEAQRLPPALAYRSVLAAQPGHPTSAALVRSRPGALWLDLPFTLQLQHFELLHHRNGTPRSFAAQVSITGKADGRSQTHHIAVNRPARVYGTDVFLTSFGDGGSPVALRPIALKPLTPDAPPPDRSASLLHTHIGQTLTVGAAQGLSGTWTLEPYALRTVQMEDLPANRLAHLPDAQASAPPDLAVPQLQHQVRQAAQWHDFGPSIAYRLRAADGQALEFHNLMRAADLGDGVAVYLLGVRERADAPFHYLRLPQDAQGGMGDFLRLSHALAHPDARQQALARYLRTGAAASAPHQQALAALVLQRFAGDAHHPGGLAALDQLLSQRVPAGHAAGGVQLLQEMLHHLLLELLQHSRQQAGLPALDDAHPTTHAFVRTALRALDALALYPHNAFFALEDFTPTYSAIFQVNRSPGQPLVFLGCLLLAAGVWAMLWVRERTLWLWLIPDATTADACQAHLAMAWGPQAPGAGAGSNPQLQASFARLAQSLLADPLPNTQNTYQK